MELTADIYIDVPPEYWALSKYRATLAHKINHSIKDANTEFGYAIHPRFGPIRTVVATQFIPKGNQLLVDYEYDTEGHSRVPKWYVNSFEAELKKVFPGNRIIDDDINCDLHCGGI